METFLGNALMCGVAIVFCAVCFYCGMKYMEYKFVEDDKERGMPFETLRWLRNRNYRVVRKQDSQNIGWKMRLEGSSLKHWNGENR